MPTKSEINAELIGRLYTQGFSYKQISRRVRLTHDTISRYISAMSLGFNSPSKYVGYIFESKGISFKDNRLRLILQRGFLSETQYRNYMAEQRQKKPKNIALSNLINTRLEEIGKSQYWLSKQIGVSRQITSFYCKGKVIPKRHVLKKIFMELEVPFRSLEEIVV